MNFTTIYQTYRWLVYYQIWRSVRQHELAEDLTQDTFVKAFRAWDRAPSAPDDLQRWLGCIARNVVIDYARHTQNVTWCELYETSAICTDDLADTLARRQQVQFVLSELPQPARQVLLASLEGYHLAEIAELLGISPDAAKVRLFRARKQFKQRYQDALDREQQDMQCCCSDQEVTV